MSDKEKILAGVKKFLDTNQKSIRPVQYFEQTDGPSLIIKDDKGYMFEFYLLGTIVFVREYTSDKNSVSISGVPFC